MRKTLLILFCAIILMKANAQVVFCPPGAEWHYTFVDYNLNPQPWFRNEAITYTGDSIIGTDTVKVLRHNRFFTWANTYGAGPTLIKQKGDTIFMQNRVTLHSWQILYNFGTQPGQSWQTTIWPTLQNSLAVTYTMQVDSVKYVQENGYTLKQLHVGLWTITERLGSNIFLFYFKGVKSDGDYVNGFLCYQDNSFGLKQFTPKPCNYTEKVGLDEISDTNSKIRVYPNPGSEILNIDLQHTGSASYQIRLANLLGEEIHAETRNGESRIELNIRDLKKGIYFLKIFGKDQLIATEKIIKE